MIEMDFQLTGSIVIHTCHGPFKAALMEDHFVYIKAALINSFM